VIRESTPDTGRLAGQLLDSLRAISDPATARDHIEAALRRVWNTRGAIRHRDRRARALDDDGRERGRAVLQEPGSGVATA
jgi:hypothetical protein